MNDTRRCDEHETTLKQLTQVLNGLAAGQIKMQGSIDTLEVKLDLGVSAITKRQDATNGRINTLEPKVQRLEVASAAQDVFTPGLSRDLMRFETAVQTKVDHLWDAVHAIEKQERTLNSDKQEARGIAKGMAITGKFVYVLAGAVSAFLGWVIMLWFQYFRQVPKPPSP